MRKLIYQQQHANRRKQEILSDKVELGSTDNTPSIKGGSGETAYDPGSGYAAIGEDQGGVKEKSRRDKFTIGIEDLVKSLIAWLPAGIFGLLVFLVIGHFSQNTSIGQTERDVIAISNEINDLKQNGRISDQDYKTLLEDIATLKEKISSVDSIKEIEKEVAIIQNELNNIRR